MNLVLNDYELNYRMAEGDVDERIIGPPPPELVNDNATTEESCQAANGFWDKNKGFCWKIDPNVIVIDDPVYPSDNKITIGTTIDKLFTTRNFLIAGVTYLLYRVIFKRHK